MKFCRPKNGVSMFTLVIVFKQILVPLYEDLRADPEIANACKSSLPLSNASNDHVSLPKRRKNV